MKRNTVGFAPPGNPGEHARVGRQAFSTPAVAHVVFRILPGSSVGRMFALARKRKVRLGPFVRGARARIRAPVRDSIGDVPCGLRGMRRIGIAGHEPDSRPLRRCTAEAVDPSERKIVRAVERDEGQPLAGRSAAERKGAAAGGAGNDSSGAGERGPFHGAGPGTASGPRRKPRPSAAGADRSYGAAGEKALEVGREHTERVVVAQRDFNRRARGPSCVAQRFEPIRISGLPAARCRRFVPLVSCLDRWPPSHVFLFGPMIPGKPDTGAGRSLRGSRPPASGGEGCTATLRPHSTASNTWTTALVHTPPWVSTIPRRSVRRGCAPSK